MIFWQWWCHWNWRSQIPGVHSLCWKLLAVLLLFGSNCLSLQALLETDGLFSWPSKLIPDAHCKHYFNDEKYDIVSFSECHIKNAWILDSLKSMAKITLSAMWKVIWKYNFIKQWCVASLYLTPWVNNKAHI